MMTKAELILAKAVLSLMIEIGLKEGEDIKEIDSILESALKKLGLDGIAEVEESLPKDGKLFEALEARLAAI